MENATLVKFEAARHALAEARSIDEVKTIRDKAVALQVYAKQIGESLEMQNDIAEIKLRAERRSGEMLKEMEKNKGGRPLNNPCPTDRGLVPTLSNLNISEKQSSNWQREASIPKEVFEQHVTETKAAGKELTSAGMLRVAQQCKRKEDEEVREQKRAENRRLVEQSDDPLKLGAKFSTILLDPPWDWDDEGDCDQFGRARPTYHTMSITEIAKLPIDSLSDKNCHLYLWSTNRSLPKVFNLITGWDFRYITCLTWCKPSFGLGNYFRGSTEQVLFAVKGSQPLRRHDMGTWFEAPRGKNHSSKPDYLYELIESCSPGPYLEMFARKERKNWTSWGAEI